MVEKALCYFVRKKSLWEECLGLLEFESEDILSNFYFLVFLSLRILIKRILIKKISLYVSRNIAHHSLFIFCLFRFEEKLLGRPNVSYQGQSVGEGALDKIRLKKLRDNSVLETYGNYNCSMSDNQETNSQEKTKKVFPEVALQRCS